jgi:autotransporter-associated beta strand protein
VLLGLGFLLGGTPAQADEYWDGTTTIGSNIAKGKGGNGTWDSSTTNWVDAAGQNPASYKPNLTAHFAGSGGVVTINNDLTFTALDFDSDGYTINGNGTLTFMPAASATIKAAAGVTANFNVLTSGTGAITINGAGAVALNNNNTYSGGTTVTNGATLYVNNFTALGSGTLTISGSGTLGTQVNSSSGGINFSNSISVLPGTTVTFSSPAVVVPNNSGVGTVSIPIGTFEMDGLVNLNGATPTFTGNVVKEQVQWGAGGIGVGGDPAGVKFTTSLSGVGNYVAFIMGGDNTNHYTGATTIDNTAFLVFEGNTAGGSIKSSIVNVNGNGVIDYLGGASAQFNSSTIVINDNSFGDTASGLAFTGFDMFNSSGDTIGTLNGSGTVGLAAATLTLSGGNFTGQISNGGHAGLSTGGIVKTGAGTLQLSGMNTYAGTTVISNGTIQALAANTFSPNSAVIIDGGATLDLNGHDQTVGSISDPTATPSTVNTINLGTGTLTTGGNNSSTTFTGTIQGSGGLTKVGTGTLTLAPTGTASVGYTGDTTVNGGTLAISTSSGSGALSSSSKLVLGGGIFQFNAQGGTIVQTMNGLTVNTGSSQVTVNGNNGATATLDLTGGITRSAGGVVDFNSGTASSFGTTAMVKTGQANDSSDNGGIIGAWATVNNGAALATVDTNGVIQAYTGYTTFNAGETITSGTGANVLIGAGGSLSTSGTTTINTLTQGSTTASTVDTSGGLVVGGTNGVGGVYITPGNAGLTIGTGAGSGTLTASNELILENYSSGGTLLINSVITGSGTAVTVAGTGVTEFATANTYTGQTVVTSGTLQLDASNAITTSSGVVVTGGTLNLNGLNTAGMTQSLTSISDGGSSAGTINLAGAKLTLGNGSADSTFSGLITDTVNGSSAGGSIFWNGGTGTLTLSNPNNSFSGGTTLSSGTLIVNGSPTDGSGTPLGSGTLTIDNGTTLKTTLQPANFSAGTTLSNAIVVNGDFNIATNVNSANPLSQNFTLNGAVDLGGTTRTITGLTNGGTVRFGGVISDGGVTFNNGSSGFTAFEYQGTSANTYTQATVVNSGAVLILNASASGTGVVSVPGDLDVEGTGVVLMGASGQLASTTIITVNSTGNSNVNGATFQGLELAGTNQTAAALQGTGKVALGSGTLTLTLSGAGTPVFSGVISDGTLGVGGSVTINGSGTQTFTGANTYTGQTLIETGTLIAGAANTIPLKSAVVLENSGILDMSGAGDSQSIGSLGDSNSAGNTGTVLLGANTLTVGNNNFTTSFGGTITGTGGITKVGGGALTLTSSGTYSYTGTTQVNGGFLVVDGTITSPVIVGDNTSSGTFVLGTTGVINPPSGSTTAVTLNKGATFTNLGNLTVTSPVTSAVTAQGAGVMIINASGATVKGPTAFLVDNTSGMVQLINDGTINGTDGVAINAQSSAGFTLYNFGTIIGQVLFGPGSSRVVLATGITPSPVKGGGANSTLVLAGGSQGVVNLNSFPNFGMLDKVGGGFWTVTGSGAFPGGTTINDGTINLLGTLTSNVTVQPVGMLTGVGTIVGNVINYGIVQPGAAVGIINPTTMAGTLHIAGNYSQPGFGQLIIQVGGSRPGEYSSLVVSGQANLGGELILQQFAKGPQLSLGQSIPILVATGGVVGQFSKIINPLTSDTVILPEVVYGRNGVLIEGLQGSFAGIQQRGVPLTANQTAVAKALDRLTAAGNSSAAKRNLVNFLDTQNIQKLPSDFDRISPEQVGSVYRMGVSLAEVQSSNLQRRMSDLRSGAEGFNATGFQTSGGPNSIGGLAGPTGPEGQPASKAVATTDMRWGGFITGLGDFIHVGSTVNSQSYNLNTGGITLGGDYRLTDNFAAGLTAGYAGTNSDLAGGGRLQVNGGKVGVYGTYWKNGFYGDVIAGVGYNSYNVRRAALQGDASGSTNGLEFDGAIAVGYDWRLEGLSIGPTASFEYTYLGMNAFQELGSLAPLAYPSQHTDSWRSTVGVRASYDWKVGKFLVRPEAQIAWQHEYGSRSASIDASLESGPGTLFSVTDANIGRDSLLLSGGVSVLFNPHTSTYLFYDADLLRKEYYSQSVTGGLRLSF